MDAASRLLDLRHKNNSNQPSCQWRYEARCSGFYESYPRTREIGRGTTRGTTHAGEALNAAARTGPSKNAVFCPLSLKLISKTKKLAAKRLELANSFDAETAAFSIPCLSKLMGKTKKLTARCPNLANGCKAGTDPIRAGPLLVVAPTRELHCQVFDEARRLCYRSMLRPCVAYGGGPVRE